MKGKALTTAQQKIFDFICHYLHEQGQVPTYATMAAHFKLSIPTIQSHLVLIEKKGFIDRQGRARGFRVVPEAIPPSIPIVGRIAAGGPAPALEVHEGTIGDIPQLHQTGNRIALRVKGDSMINAHIMPGDVVIIQRDALLRNGDIVAVYLDGEATLKRFFRERDHIVLKPENPAYAPITVISSHYPSVIGKMIALIRV